MKTKSLIGLFVGIVAVCLLIAWQGVAAVLGQLAEGGWGILWVCMFAVPTLLLSAEALRVLFPPAHRPPAKQVFLASSMGVAVNALLPVATIGGEAVKARILTLWSHPATHTVSTAIVDKTVQAIVILLWGLAGTVMLAVLVDNQAVIYGAFAGAALLAIGIGGFIWVQYAGSMSFLARFASRFVAARKWQGMVEDAAAVDAAIRDIYHRKLNVSAACALRLTMRIVLVGEVVLAGHLIGYPIGIAEALLLKGLVVALRGMSFAVPAGLGIQEGGYIAVGALIGMPPDVMIAVSLISRVREILPNIPFLLLWHHTEGKALWRRHRGAASGS